MPPDSRLVVNVVRLGTTPLVKVEEYKSSTFSATEQKRLARQHKNYAKEIRKFPDKYHQMVSECDDPDVRILALIMSSSSNIPLFQIQQAIELYESQHPCIAHPLESRCGLIAFVACMNECVTRIEKSTESEEVNTAIARLLLAMLGSIPDFKIEECIEHHLVFALSKMVRLSLFTEEHEQSQFLKFLFAIVDSDAFLRSSTALSLLHVMAHSCFAFDSNVENIFSYHSAVIDIRDRVLPEERQTPCPNPFLFVYYCPTQCNPMEGTLLTLQLDFLTGTAKWCNFIRLYQETPRSKNISQLGALLLTDDACLKVKASRYVPFSCGRVVQKSPASLLHQCSLGLCFPVQIEPYSDSLVCSFCQRQFATFVSLRQHVCMECFGRCFSLDMAQQLPSSFPPPPKCS